jgi:hypothetical protein
MSNRQLGWDEKQVKDRIAPREDAQADKELAQKQNAENDEQFVDKQDDGWIPPGNTDQGSRK